MAGGTQITISPEGITIKTVGYVKFLAAEHIFEGGQHSPVTFPILPSVGMYNISYEVRDKHTQELLPFTRYVLTNEQGQSIYGTTDENGLTETIYSDKEENYSLHVMTDEFKDLNFEDDNNGEI